MSQYSATSGWCFCGRHNSYTKQQQQQQRRRLLQQKSAHFESEGAASFQVREQPRQRSSSSKGSKPSEPLGRRAGERTNVRRRATGGLSSSSSATVLLSSTLRLAVAFAIQRTGEKLSGLSERSPAAHTHVGSQQWNAPKAKQVRSKQLTSIASLSFSGSRTEPDECWLMRTKLSCNFWKKAKFI